MLKSIAFFCAVLAGLGSLEAQTPYNGIGSGLSNLYELSPAHSRSLSPENPDGKKGQGGMASTGTGAGPARELGQGWKVSPSIDIAAGTTYTVADISGSGDIEHIWMTPTGNWRYEILRIYWDDETTPSVEAPVGDFFCMGWGVYAPVHSIPVVVNPGSAFNCYWPMPFRHHCRITLENLDAKAMTLYYQVDYIQTAIPEDAAYFHAQFRRVAAVPYKDNYVILDSVRGKGQYVGTYMAFEAHDNGWWGEGEIKFYIDGDGPFPTICGTGTEDYFCGSYDFDSRKPGASDRDETQFTEFTGPYTGLAQVIRGDGHYGVMQRFGLYRFHITDPVRFDKDLKVTIQDLGWHQDGRYLPRQDGIATVAYWYQTEPHTPFPAFPSGDELEIR